MFKLDSNTAMIFLALVMQGNENFPKWGFSQDPYLMGKFYRTTTIIFKKLRRMLLKLSINQFRLSPEDSQIMIKTRVGVVIQFGVWELMHALHRRFQ